MEHHALTDASAVPTLSNTGVPELNRPFSLSVAGAKPNGIGVLLHGASDATWLGQFLPFDLTPLGAAGCKVFASGEILLGITTDASGASTQNFTLSNQASLFGVTFFNQYAIADSANVFGSVLSNAGKGRIGKQ